MARSLPSSTHRYAGSSPTAVVEEGVADAGAPPGRPDVEGQHLARDVHVLVASGAGAHEADQALGGLGDRVFRLRGRISRHRSTRSGTLVRRASRSSCGISPV